MNNLLALFNEVMGRYTMPEFQFIYRLEDNDWEGWIIYSDNGSDYYKEFEPESLQSLIVSMTNYLEEKR